MADLKRLRGLRALIEDAVEHGSGAIERVHLATAARPFEVLESIAPTALVARTVHVAHDAIASSMYGTIRATNRVLGIAATMALDIAETLADDADEDS
jgi:hypothetical protein